METARGVVLRGGAGAGTLVRRAGAATRRAVRAGADVGGVAVVARAGAGATGDDVLGADAIDDSATGCRAGWTARGLVGAAVAVTPGAVASGGAVVLGAPGYAGRKVAAAVGVLERF